QLESFKAGIGRDLPGTLQKARDFGFKYVELVGDYHQSPEALKTNLAAHGLIAISAHFPYARFRDDPEGVAKEAGELGLKMAGCPALPQGEKLDQSGCDAAIAMFN